MNKWLGRTYEAATSRAKQLQDMSSTPVHGIGSRQRTCLNCGGQHSLWQRELCPACGSECSACHKKNHWATVCMSSKQRPKSKSKSRFSWSKSRNGRTQKREAQQKALHCVQNPANSQPGHVNDQLEALSFSAVQMSVSSMMFTKSPPDEAYATLDIKLLGKPGIHNLMLKVDTGAQGNTLPLRIFRKMFPDLVNEQGKPVESIAVSGRSARLTAYNNTSIPCYGTTYIQCQYHESEWFDTKFFSGRCRRPSSRWTSFKCQT